MSGRKERGWNEEQRKTLTRGGEALRRVGEVGFSWLFGSSRDVNRVKREIAEGFGEKVEEMRQAGRRDSAITVAGEPVEDEELESGNGDDVALNRIECLTCQTMVGALSPTATHDPRAIRDFAELHEGHNLNRVRPVKRP